MSYAALFSTIPPDEYRADSEPEKINHFIVLMPRGRRLLLTAAESSHQRHCCSLHSMVNSRNDRGQANIPHSSTLEVAHLYVEYRSKQARRFLSAIGDTARFRIYATLLLNYSAACRCPPASRRPCTNIGRFRCSLILLFRDVLPISVSAHSDSILESLDSQNSWL